MKQSPVRAATLAFALTLGALPAIAAPPQDAPKAAEGEKPAEGEKAAEPAKTPERKSDPKAQALVDAYAKAIHTPKAAGVKAFSMSAEAHIGFPAPIGVNSKWSADGGLGVEIVIPKSLEDALPPEMLDMARGLANDILVDKLVRPLIEGALHEAQSYDLAWEETKDGQVVKLKPFAKKTTWERLAVTFGKDGLVTAMTGVPNVDPADPIAGMYAGLEVEFKITHAKIGEKHALETVIVNTPVGEISTKSDYYEGPGGLPLVRSIAITFTSGEEGAARFFDYVVDGKPVAGTEKKKPGEKTDAVTPSEPAPEKAPEKAPDAPK